MNGLDRQTRGLVYDIPLRPNFNVQLVLPYDLTTAEAAKLAAMLTTLVAPDRVPEPQAEHEPADLPPPPDATPEAEP